MTINDHIEEVLKRFSELAPEYGKWRIDKNIAKSFFREELHSIVQSAKKEALEGVRDAILYKQLRDSFDSIDINTGYNLAARDIQAIITNEIEKLV